MKRFLTIALAAASIGFLAVGTASAATWYTGAGSISTYNAGDAANGIGNSRHNLGALGAHVTAVDNTSTTGMNGTTEICVFCHTPHHTSTGGTGAPLWNRGNATGSYTAYGTTVGGTNITTVGGTSLACLSCHDGVTTFDNLVNAPGKGGVSGTAGSGANGAASDRGYTIWEVNASTGVGGVVSDFMTSTRLNIGTNLSNDHPVSVAYPTNIADTTKVGIASLRHKDTVISAVDVAAGLAASAATWDGGNLTKNLWAVKGFVNADATINDLLRGNGKVECSSCHDPHFNNKSFNEVDSTYYNSFSVNTGQLMEEESNGLFLRRVGGNSGSGLCRTCHAK